ncbi:Maf family protein [Thermodesulfobacteriota bacterium]
MTFKTITHDYPLILASESPRRKSLLQQIGLPFRTLPSRVDETYEMDDPAERALRLAERKAFAVQQDAADSWILGADTLVVVGEMILGKPDDRTAAHSMIEILSGKAHTVITGFCLLNPSGKVAHLESISTRVKIKPLNEREIESYIATGEPFGKAGSYAIQGIGAFMVEGITGSYSNVVGLPVCALIKSLITSGALESFPH